MLRSSSRSSWQQNALDLVVEGCRTVAPLAAKSAGVRRELEEAGYEGALRWLEERVQTPLAELSAHLEREAIKEALTNAEIPPPWDTPPEELLEHLAQLEEKARVALRMYARTSSPSLFLKQAPANQPSADGGSAERAPSQGTSPALGERASRSREAVHLRARERLARMKAGLVALPEGAPGKEATAPDLPSDADTPHRPKRARRTEQPALRLSLHGPSPGRYQRLADGSTIPVFTPSARLIVKVSGGREAGPAMNLLVTSEHEAHALVWPEKEGAHVAVLDELEPGAYSLDLLDGAGTALAQRSFLVEACASLPPKMVARVFWGGTETAWEGDLSFSVVLRGDERLELRLPPLWSVRVFWREASVRSLGRFSADSQGCLDLSERLASMRHLLTTTSVANLEVDAGELGILTLCHDQPPSTEEILTRLMELARERVAHLPRGSLELLRPLWIEPVCKTLGYAVSRPRRSAEGFLLQELSSLVRSEGKILRLSYAYLWLSPEPPSISECQLEMAASDLPRVLWTNGWSWMRAELGRRHWEKIAELPFPAAGAPALASSATPSFRSLVERLGA